jgi:hypothetical protein
MVKAVEALKGESIKLPLLPVATSLKSAIPKALPWDITLEALVGRLKEMGSFGVSVLSFEHDVADNKTIMLSNAR